MELISAWKQVSVGNRLAYVYTEMGKNRMQMCDFFMEKRKVKQVCNGMYLQHICVNMYVCTNMYVCMYASKYTYMNICMYVRMHAMYVYIYPSMYVCMYVSLYAMYVKQIKNYLFFLEQVLM